MFTVSHILSTQPPFTPQRAPTGRGEAFIVPLTAAASPHRLEGPPDSRREISELRRPRLAPSGPMQNQDPTEGRKITEASRMEGHTSISPPRALQWCVTLLEPLTVSSS